jgi:hypothetical protein
VIKKPTTKKVISGSALPCPYGWFSSAGRLEYFIPNKTKKDEKISVVDSMASAINAYELPKKPANPLIIANAVLPIKLK